MAELCAAYGKPFGAGAPEMVKVYHAVLSPDFSNDEVQAAVVHQACKTLERFPKPAQLRAMCYAARPKRSTIHHDDPSDACQQCGTAYQWRRLPHWAHAKMGVNAAHDLQCDCGWRVIVKAYATEEDLAEMGGDPFAEDELRRRAINPRRAA
jgi:hypothetical protein